MFVCSICTATRQAGAPTVELEGNIKLLVPTDLQQLWIAKTVQHISTHVITLYGLLHH